MKTTIDIHRVYTHFLRATSVALASLIFTAVVAPHASAQTQPAPAQITIVSGNNQSLIPTQSSQAMVVQVQTAQGAPVQGASITWAAAGATASLGSASTKTDASGRSSNTLSTVLPGAYQVTAQLTDSQSPSSVTFNFVTGVANLPALTPAQISVAHAIDVACPALATAPAGSRSAKQNDFLGRCSEVVVGAKSAAIPSVLDQMLNNKAQPQSQLSSDVQTSQFNNLNTRMAELRQGVSGFSMGGLAISSDGQTLPLAMLGDAFYKDPAQRNDQAGNSFSRWGFFATGMINHGGFAANESRPGFNFDSAAITAGVDYRFNDAFVGGVALGYNHDSSDLNLDAGNLDADGYSLNAYFTYYHNNDFYLEGSIAATKLDFDLKRHILYQIAAVDGSGGTTTVDQIARSSPGGNQAAFNLTVGHDFNNGAWAISPYLRGSYSHTSLDAFSETIDNSTAPGFGLATSVESRTRTSEIGIIGSRFSYTMSQSWGVLIPNAVVEYNHEFKDDPQTVVMRFLADPTQTPVVVTDPRQDQNYFNLGLGLNAVLPQGRSGYFYYEHVAGLAGAHLNRFTLGVRIEF